MFSVKIQFESCVSTLPHEQGKAAAVKGFLWNSINTNSFPFLSCPNSHIPAEMTAFPAIMLTARSAP